MFQFAYESYLTHASDYDELKPLSCAGQNTWGSYSLTLIDSLDTLGKSPLINESFMRSLLLMKLTKFKLSAVMGNFSEFRRVVDLLTKKTNFDTDINVSVFETNIRIVGGLLSAHLLSHKAGVELEPGWPCNGPLLRLAEDIAKRLLPAFDTKTGMPYGTVNLRNGVPSGVSFISQCPLHFTHAKVVIFLLQETPITCTAGIGTFIIEFGALSRLTGDPIYEEVALNSLYSLYDHRSSIGLFGNHIDVQTGTWTGQDAGIGAGVDSYYEYLVKGSIMLNRPELMQMFNEGRKAIDKFLKKDDWYVWSSMNKGQLTLPVFQSLEAFFPGVLSLLGDIGAGMKSLHNYHSVWKQYGFLPEFYNIPNLEASQNRESYPLRPELIESVMYLYRATGDPYLLEVGEDMLRSIQYSAKTSCGYATIKNVRDHRKEDRMESFFLAETTKYLYLLFDPDNFLNNDGSFGTVIDTPNGECVIESGYIFNTEAHPIDSSALKCCHDMPRESLLKDFNPKKFLGDLFEPMSEKQEQDDASFKDWFNNRENAQDPKMDVVKTTNDFKKALVNEIISALADNKRKIEDNVDLQNKFVEITDREKNNLNIVELKEPAVVAEKAKSKDDSLVIAVDNSATKTETEEDDIKSENVPIEIVKVPSPTITLETEKKPNQNPTIATPPIPTTEKQPTKFVTYDSEKTSDESKETIETQNKSNPEKDYIKVINTSENSNSIFSEFVQAILRTQLPKKFDSQELLNRIRQQSQFRNTSWNNKYELLSCKAQPYLQRMSVLGEFF